MKNYEEANLEKNKYFFELNKPLNNLSDYIKTIITLVQKNNIPVPWFRGQSNNQWDLIASINRPDIDEFWRKSEAFNLLTFINEGSLSSKLRENYEYFNIYYMMQHYGFPTRLIDWTESALLALYFALESHNRTEDLSNNNDASVWILDPYWLNKEAVNSYGPPSFNTRQDIESFLNFISNVNDKNVPLPIIPAHPDERMVYQRSRFTFDQFLKAHHCGFKNFKEHKLYKVNIAKEAFVGILGELRIMGVSQRSVFPDLDNITQDMLNYPKTRKLPKY